jgi:hypothetical protein
VRSGFFWLRSDTRGAVLNFGLNKIRAIFWVAEAALASWERLGCTECIFAIRLIRRKKNRFLASKN